MSRLDRADALYRMCEPQARATPNSSRIFIASSGQIALAFPRMTEQVSSKLAKWPFFLADVMLISVAALVIYQAKGALTFWHITFCLAAVALGGWMSVLPFLKEFQASVRIAESNALSTAAAQIENLEEIKTQISQATGHWMQVQDHSAKTVNAAQELTDRMKAEAKEFSAVLTKINEAEKSHLRLEVDKLRRSESEWLQLTVRILDHIYALNQAAARSGQPGLISQLSQFQNVCREAVRRQGLVPFVVKRDEPYDPKTHQLLDPTTKPSEHAQVAETLATGFTFQAQLLRKALVSLRPDSQPELPFTGVDDESDQSALLADNPLRPSDASVEVPENASR
jgi:molecular chaperone GrpE (heat shock protein)